jgi:hypothetical protein
LLDPGLVFGVWLKKTFLISLVMMDGYRKAKPDFFYQTKISEAPKNLKSEVVYSTTQKMTATASWAIKYVGVFFGTLRVLQ